MKIAMVIGATVFLVSTAVAQQPAAAPQVLVAPTITSLIKDGYDIVGTGVGPTLSVFLRKGGAFIYCESASGGGAISRTTKCIPIE